MQGLTFDAASHTYRLDGEPIDGVTSVLNRIMPGYQASQWHLNRGTAVHAAAAMIGRGQEIANLDPRIAGQAEACRLFWREWNPAALAIEERVVSRRHRYAGTMDLLAGINGKLTMIDYKGSIGPGTGHQLAAYAIAAEECGIARTGLIKHGLAVVLAESGKYSVREYDLRPLRAEWLALLAADRIRRREGVTE